ncbi:hypothetical protein T492DRAFT_1059666 [Pavlovales sp. CCMP2436]|nr:hypothetical protein T492DRAFT_1059666 [Pavlovales sp. CCMP2436]
MAANSPEPSAHKVGGGADGPRARAPAAKPAPPARATAKGRPARQPEDGKHPSPPLPKDGKHVSVRRPPSPPRADSPDARAAAQSTEARTRHDGEANGERRAAPDVPEFSRLSRRNPSRSAQLLGGGGGEAERGAAVEGEALGKHGGYAVHGTLDVPGYSFAGGRSPPTPQRSEPLEQSSGDDESPMLGRRRVPADGNLLVDEEVRMPTYTNI